MAVGIVFIATLLSTVSCCSFAFLVRYNSKTNFILKSDTTGENSELIKAIKLPIVQIYVDQNLVGEFICGNELENSISKLKVKLNELSEINGSSGSIENMYSDEMLQTGLSESKNIIIKLYRDGCKKCSILEPIYANFPIEYKNNFRWIQAKTSDVPTYVAGIKKRLTGVNLKLETETCIICNNTGFIKCQECSGFGYMQRSATLTVFCPTCVGYKKIRCTNCGGKCINCS
jgi:hypothetical protein